MDFEGMTDILSSVVILLFILIGISAKKKKKATKKAFTFKKDVHNHNRLDDNVNVESLDEHYKKQLDGFLKAGIIDRDEYRLLVKKYTK